MLSDTQLKEQIGNLTENLNDIFIVSQAKLVDTIDDTAYHGQDIEGLAIKVYKAAGEKCERCWRFDETIGNDSEHPTACERCSDALKKIL
jgi:isoleucyl-tRNA synthetase